MYKNEIFKSVDASEFQSNGVIEEDEKLKLGFKDFIAICIAIFQVVMPMVLAGFSIFAIVLIFVTKVWIK